MVLEAEQEKTVNSTLEITQTSSDTIDFVISMGKIDGEETPASDIETSDISIVKL